MSTPIYYYPSGCDRWTATASLSDTDIQILEQDTRFTVELMKLIGCYLRDQVVNVRKLGLYVLRPPGARRYQTENNSKRAYLEIRKDWRYLVMALRTPNGSNDPQRWNVVLVDGPNKRVILYDTDMDENRTNQTSKSCQELLRKKFGGAAIVDGFDLRSWRFSLAPEFNAASNASTHRPVQIEEVGSGAFCSTAMRLIIESVVNADVKGPSFPSWEAIIQAYSGEGHRLEEMLKRLLDSTLTLPEPPKRLHRFASTKTRKPVAANENHGINESGSTTLQQQTEQQSSVQEQSRALSPSVSSSPTLEESDDVYVLGGSFADVDDGWEYLFVRQRNETSLKWYVTLFDRAQKIATLYDTEVRENEFNGDMHLEGRSTLQMREFSQFVTQWFDIDARAETLDVFQKVLLRADRPDISVEDSFLFGGVAIRMAQQAVREAKKEGMQVPVWPQADAIWAAVDQLDQLQRMDDLQHIDEIQRAVQGEGNPRLNRIIQEEALAPAGDAHDPGPNPAANRQYLGFLRHLAVLVLKIVIGAVMLMISYSVISLEIQRWRMGL